MQLLWDRRNVQHGRVKRVQRKPKDVTPGVQALGSGSGKPSKSVKIAKSGELPSKS